MIKTEQHSILDRHRDRVSTVEFWSNGIIYIQIDDKAEIELEDAKRQYEFLLSKYNGKNKHRVLVDPGKFTTLSKEAREFSQRPESNAMTLATAVIARSLAQRIVINFMISIIHQQTMKMRMFETKEKAIQWLLTRKENE